MRDAVEFIQVMVRGDVEALVNVRVEFLVTKPGFAKSSHMRIPAARLEIEAREGGDGAAERVPDEHEFVAGILLQRCGYVRQDDFARVQPRGVEARVDGAVSALWGFGGGWVVVAGLARREEV